MDEEEKKVAAKNAERSVVWVGGIIAQRAERIRDLLKQWVGSEGAIPSDKVWNEIRSLRDKLNEIVPTPGPKVPVPGETEPPKTP